MIQYINGSGKPRIRIELAGTVVQSYDFPLTLWGLKEQWSSNDVEGESIDLDTLETSYEYYEGYWTGVFTLDYSAYMVSTYLLYIQEISNYARLNALGYEVWLTPRIDRPDREYKVKMINDFSFGITKGGTGAIGNKGITLTFRTLESFRYGQWVYGDLEKIVLTNFAVI